MVLRSRPGLNSFADFLELVSEDQKADLLDGVIYMASPENIEHGRLIAWLAKILGCFVEERQLGEVTLNRIAYRLSPKDSPEPDVAFLRTDRSSIIKHGYVDGPPDLAVEVVSPESVERDYEQKRDRYERAGVGEYWIIDPDEKRATLLTLVETPGTAPAYREAALDGTIFRSKVVPGFVLDVNWFWQRPLPPALKTVQSMLAKDAP
jgi:Uma2 family endonuclease